MITQTAWLPCYSECWRCAKLPSVGSLAPSFRKNKSSSMSLCDSRRRRARCLVLHSTEGPSDPCEAAAIAEFHDGPTQEVEGTIQARPSRCSNWQGPTQFDFAVAARCKALDRKTRVVPQAETVCTCHGALCGSGFLVRSIACSSSSKGVAKMSACVLCKLTPWRQAHFLHCS